MEQRQNGVWKNVGYGEFDSFEEASRDTEVLIEQYLLDPNDVRIRAVNEIPMDELVLCECGFPLSFTAEAGRTFCRRCEEFKTREDL